jgi:hypothetical protein
LPAEGLVTVMPGGRLALLLMVASALTFAPVQPFA